jgi:phosphoglycerol transferase
MTSRKYFLPVAAYAVAGLVCLAVLTWVLRLHQGDLRFPLQDGGDCVWAQITTLGFIEEGTWYSHSRAAAPYGMDQRDFPVPDTLHLGVMKLISLAAPGIYRVINVYFLLTFFLTALSTLFVLRHFGVGPVPAVVAGLLYAFLPYHFIRFSHLFLASYYLIPPTTMVLLWLYHGRLQRAAPEGGGTAPAGARPVGRWLMALLLCLLVSSAGVYYAFFACYLLLVAGLAAGWQQRRLAPVGISGVLVAVTSLGLAANLAPCYAFQRQNGANPLVARRSPDESNFHGLKLANLVLPGPQHRLGRARRVWSLFAQRCPIVASGEHWGNTLGAAGSAGFAALLLLFLCGRGRDEHELLRPLGLFALACVLLGTVGGLSALFAAFVSPQIRCYNRICIYIAFFSLFAVGVLLDRLLGAARARRPLARGGGYALCGAVLALGLWDQTSPLFRPDHAGHRESVLDLEDYARRVEEALPEGAAVLQLPVVDFPEPVRRDHQLLHTEHFRLLLASQHLRISQGNVKGRYGARMLSWMVERPTPAMLEQAVALGFLGVHVDRRGYPADAGKAVEASLGRHLGVEPLVSRDGRYAFFSLQGKATELRRRHSSPGEWESWRQGRLYLPLAWYDQGFQDGEGGATDRRAANSRAEVGLMNPLAEARWVTLRFRARACQAAGTLRLSGPSLEAAVPIHTAPIEISHSILLPPGTHSLRFDCDAPAQEEGGRKLAFALEDLEILPQTEEKVPAVVRQGHARLESPGGPGDATGR